MLDKIAQKFGTDKSSKGHNYTPHYECILSHLRSEPINLLEIGVRQGWSHQMWSEFFFKGHIYGIDNCLESEFNSDHSHLLLKGIKIFYGNQEDKIFLESTVKTIIYDVIIDDGGHKMKEQQLSLLYLIDSVKSGGFYFIEDLHTCSSPHYYQDGIYPQDSTITLLNNLKSYNTMPNSFVNKSDMNYLQDNIADIIFLKETLALIIKK